MRVLVVVAILVGLAGAAFGEYQSRGKRDPFHPLLSGKGERLYPPGWDEEMPEGVEGLALEGVVFDPAGRSYALINGKIVRVDGEVEGMRVLAIGPDSVSILADGQEHILRLRKAERLTPAPKRGRPGSEGEGVFDGPYGGEDTW